MYLKCYKIRNGWDISENTIYRIEYHVRTLSDVEILIFIQVLDVQWKELVAGVSVEVIPSVVNHPFRGQSR